MRMLSDTAAVDASSAPLLVTPASVAATTVGSGYLQPPPAGESDAGFDTDMVVILAAMLCFVVGAIGLNSLITCLRLHCCAHRTIITDADAGAGLKKKELRRIPVVVYDHHEAISKVCVRRRRQGASAPEVLPWLPRPLHRCVVGQAPFLPHMPEPALPAPGRWRKQGDGARGRDMNMMPPPGRAGLFFITGGISR
ncbi:unnamed protein product [Urochloa humidicola]